jgi:acyl-CoA thioesterase-1
MHIFIRSILCFLCMIIATSPEHVLAENDGAHSGSGTKPANFNRTPENALIMLIGDDYLASKGTAEGGSTFAKLLKAMYVDNGFEIDVLDNTAIGVTTEQVLAQLQESVAYYMPDVVLIQLGLSDYNANVPVQTIQYNLDLIVWKLKKYNPKIRIVMIGEYFSSSYKTLEYNKQMNAMYKYIAGRYQIPLYPMFRQRTVGTPVWNYNYHAFPTPFGLSIILKDMKPYIHKSISDAVNDVFLNPGSRYSGAETGEPATQSAPDVASDDPKIETE